MIESGSEDEDTRSTEKSGDAPSSEDEEVGEILDEQEELGESIALGIAVRRRILLTSLPTGLQR